MVLLAVLLTFWYGRELVSELEVFTVTAPVVSDQIGDG